MSYAIQILCGLALVFGATMMIGYRLEDDRVVKWAVIFFLLGVPFIAAYFVGMGRRILARLDELEKKIDSSRKQGTA
jgi:hypothetical protein